MNKQALIALFLLALVLRIGYFFWQNVPVLNQDEAALLLNARFITETGRDEWQQFLPFTFRSFGDYKLPGYIYGTSLVGSVLGFSLVSVRFLSFMAGLGNIVLMYLLGKRLFSQSVGWWSALLLVLSPWSWHYSSVGFEANVGLFFFLMSFVVLLQKPITARSGIVVVGSLLLGGFTYNSPFLLSPLLLWVLILWHGIKSRESQSLLSGILATMMMLLLLTLPATMQKEGISLFSDPTLLSLYPSYRASFSGINQTLIGNQYVYFGLLVVKNLFRSFSWIFLVTQGGSNPWHTIPGIGHLHFLIPIGAAMSLGAFVKALQLSRWRSKALMMFGLLLGSLLPAVITVDAPHATRSLFFFIMITLFAGVVFAEVEKNISVLPRKGSILSVLIFLLMAGFLQWWVPSRALWRSLDVQDRRWPVGLPAALQSLPSDLQDVAVADAHGVLYTFVANETNMSPMVFWETIHRSEPDTAGLVRVERLGRFSFVQEKPSEFTGHYLAPVSSQKWAIIDL